MLSKKFTLSTLALALSVVLASCSGGAGSTDSGSSTSGSSSTASTKLNTRPQVDPLTTIPPVVALPKTLDHISFPYQLPKEDFAINGKEENYSVGKQVDFTDATSISVHSIALQQADQSFTGKTGYEDLKKAWDVTLASDVNTDLELLAKYGEGVAPIFSSKPSYVPSEISFVEKLVTKDTTSYKTLVKTSSATDHFAGSNISVAVVTNGYDQVVDNTKDVFNHDLKTVDLETQTPWAEQKNLAITNNLSANSMNAFMLSANLAGKRNSLANGLVENAQVYISTVNSKDITKYQYPKDIYLNLYHHAHPSVILTNTVEPTLFINKDSANFDKSKISTIANAMANAIEQVTASKTITDKPLFVMPTGDYSARELRNNRNKFLLDKNHAGKGLNGHINDNDMANLDLSNQLLDDYKVSPYAILVTGAYYDPQGIYAGIQENFKGKINRIPIIDKDNYLKTPSSAGAVENAATQYQGKDVNVDSASDNTLQDRSNYVSALGTYQCGINRYNCLAASADYTSNLINRKPGYSQSIADAIFPVSSTDKRFQHTDFSSAYAAAQVAAAAVAVKQQFPWFTPQNLKTTLLTTATQVGQQERVSYEFGWGFLNLANALGGPAQFAFGDFVVNFNQITFNNYRDQVLYNYDHKANGHYAYTSYFTHNIMGSGGLYIYGSNQDTLVLTGINSYKGNTYVLGGNLIVGNPTKLVNPLASHFNKQSALDSSSVYVGPNATLTGISAEFGKEIYTDGVAKFTDSNVYCSITGTGSLNVTGGVIGSSETTHNHCQYGGITGSRSYGSASQRAIVNFSSDYKGNITLNNTEVFGNVNANTKQITITNTKVHGSISSQDTDNLTDGYGKRVNKYANLSLKDSVIDYDINVSGNVTIINSTLGVDKHVTSKLYADSQISNSTFFNLQLSKDSTLYFDPSAKTNIVNNSLGLFGKLAVVNKDQFTKQDFVPKTDQKYTIFKSYSLTGDFENKELKSNQALIKYSVALETIDDDINFKHQVVVTAHSVDASTASVALASGSSAVDHALITNSVGLVDGLISKANQVYQTSNSNTNSNFNSNHNSDAVHSLAATQQDTSPVSVASNPVTVVSLASQSSASNLVTVASNLQHYTKDQLKQFLVQASAPIYADAILSNLITLNDQYLDFSQQVNANYYDASLQGKVKAYISYNYGHNLWDSEFNKSSNQSSSLAGSHSYSTNLKGKQASNGISAGAYSQFGNYNLGLAANYLHNNWQEYYADYAKLASDQSQVLRNLGTSQVNTISLMLSASRVYDNYYLGTSVYGDWQAYDVKRSSLNQLDQQSSFNTYGLTVNINSGYRYLLSANSGISGQASLAYNYNYHGKFTETGASALAKVLSYQIHSQSINLVYSNLQAQYFYNFKLFGLEQGVNLTLGYTVNFFNHTNQELTNQATKVNLASSQAFSGSNANLLKLALGYKVVILPNLDLDLDASYYTNHYWNGYKGQATLTYSF